MHFPEWKYIFISNKISLKFVLKGPINNIPALGQIMAWRHSDSNPSSEPRVVSLLMHRCITQLQYMMTSSNGNIFRITGYLCGEFTKWFPCTKRPVTRSFDVFFDLRLNKRLRKQSWGWWFETLPCPLWRHSNEVNKRCQNCFAILHTSS